VIALLVKSEQSEFRGVIRDVLEAARTKGVQLDILRAGAEGDSRPSPPPSPNCQPARSSSAATRSSSAGASSLWRWRHAMPFRRSMTGAASSRPAA